jgi:hypothetical protein
LCQKERTLLVILPDSSYTSEELTQLHETKMCIERKKGTACYDDSDFLYCTVQAKDTSSLFYPVFFK